MGESGKCEVRDTGEAASSRGRLKGEKKRKIGAFGSDWKTKNNKKERVRKKER